MGLMIAMVQRSISSFGCDEDFLVCFQTGHVYNKATDTYTALRPLDGDDSVAPFVMSSNGKVAVGSSYTSTLDLDVFFVAGQLVTWNLSNGVPTALGSPNTAWFVGNFGGVTEDGKAIIANFVDIDPIDGTGIAIAHPYLHNENGFFELEDVLSDAGVDLTEWLFTFDENAFAHCGDAGGTAIFGISPDGRLIFGAALHNGVPEGFIVSGLPKNYLEDYGN